MKYCSNCGREVNPNALVCLNCGVALRNDFKKEENPSNGTGNASMVLGIISIIVSSIALFLALAVRAYLTGTIEGRIEVYSSDFNATRIGLYILLLTLPLILSIIGLPLGFASKNKSASKNAGIVLNSITLVICIIIFVMIQSI